MKYLAIGQMSGTSLDGCDWVEVEFEFSENWTYRIHSAATYPYSETMANDLRRAREMSAVEFSELCIVYENVLAEQYSQFTTGKAKPALVALHGHTVFHQPENGFTTQIGRGTEIVRRNHVDVVSDFRSADVALGGQGAPLVPIGDRLLFSNYDACINLGGYANISFEKDGRRIAYDIGPCNYPLNYLAQKVGKKYDENGTLAYSGEIVKPLYNAIRELDYFKAQPPKSIGNEWFDAKFEPLLKNDFSVADNIATTGAALADIIRDEIQKNKFSRVLLTGGGALNSFLTERIQKTDSEVIIPDSMTIEYKEALIFALMGVLRIRGDINVLSSATGASQDHSSGIHLVP